MVVILPGVELAHDWSPGDIRKQLCVVTELVDTADQAALRDAQNKWIIDLLDEGVSKDFTMNDFKRTVMEIGNPYRQGFCDAERIVHTCQAFISICEGSFPRSPGFSQLGTL
jgi:hypothetical protein